jgi:hypothetical protein
MNATLRDLFRESTTEVKPYRDFSTAEGYFAASATILGVFTTYLLRDSVDNEASPVVGRIEYHRPHRSVLVRHQHVEAFSYRGDSLKGGELIGFNRTQEEIFKRLAS